MWLSTWRAIYYIYNALQVAIENDWPWKYTNGFRQVDRFTWPWPYCSTSTEAARLLIREGGGGGGARDWRLDHGYRPKKTGETVDRRPNNGSVKAVPPRHCPATSALAAQLPAVSTAVLGRVTRSMSVALLLRNNPKGKKSNFRSPAPPPCSWSLLG